MDRVRKSTWMESYGHLGTLQLEHPNQDAILKRVLSLKLFFSTSTITVTVEDGCASRLLLTRGRTKFKIVLKPESDIPSRIPEYNFRELK